MARERLDEARESLDELAALAARARASGTLSVTEAALVEGNAFYILSRL